MVGGDYNAKHSHWSSRLTTPRGRKLLKAIRAENLSHVSTGETNCWPSDRRKVPDLIDFGILKRLPVRSLRAESSFDLSSDHSSSCHKCTFEDHSSNKSSKSQQQKKLEDI